MRSTKAPAVVEVPSGTGAPAMRLMLLRTTKPVEKTQVEVASAHLFRTLATMMRTPATKPLLVSSGTAVLQVHFAPSGFSPAAMLGTLATKQ